jgi:hypothetical protein
MTSREPTPAAIDLEQAIGLLRESHVRGERDGLPSLLNQFPDLARSVAGVLKLIEADVRIRAENASPWSDDDYLGLLPACRLQVAQLLETLKPLDTTPVDRSCSLDSTLEFDPTNPPSPPGEEPLPYPTRIGRYDVRRVLGSGGFGAVLLALDAELNREVAVKLPRRKLTAATAIDAFRKEARNLAAFSHPSLVAVHDFGLFDDGRPYFVTEYLPGPTLRERLDGRTINPLDATRVVLLLAQALHAAHRRGLVHRDVKPENVLFDADGRPKLVDFGLALFDEEQSGRKGEIAGTPHYMSPEQVEGKVHHLDGRTDVWALGVILYEIWCGVRPFHATGQAELFDEIVNRPPKPPRMLGDVPRGVEEIVLKCLAKWPADRFPTGDDLASALERFLNEKQPSPSPVPDAPPINRRRVAVIVAAAGALAVLGFAAIGAVSQMARPRGAFTPASPPAALPSETSPSQAAPSDTRLALEGDVLISLWNEQLPGRTSLPLEDALPLREGDAIRVDVYVNRPAFLYVLWIAADGVTPLYPWTPGSWDVPASPQVPVRHVSLPQALDEGWPMKPSQGMETILMLASEQPIDTVELRQTLEDFPVPRSSASLQLVRLDDKDPSTEGRDAPDGLRFRSPELKPVKLDDPQQQAKQFLAQRLAGRADLLRAKGFWNAPSESRQ